MKHATKIIVLGAGVIGLTSAIRLLEQGESVTIWTRDLPQHTTSRLAAALWYPYLTNADAIGETWGQTSFEEFGRLANDPTSGVFWRTTLVVFRTPVERPLWAGSISGFRDALPGELPIGYTDGYVVPLPVIEMPVYLDYLLNRVRHLGGDLCQRTVRQPIEPFEAGADLIVNCTGLGAGELFGDDLLVPVRGQIVRGSGVNETRAIFEIDSCTYYVPRTSDCILGGTADADNHSLEPDSAIAEDILQRCGDLGVDLSDLVRLEDLVGFRPCRESVRFTTQEIAPGRPVVHCYGHGGAGVTLSWGCADAVVQEVLNYRHHADLRS